MKPSTLILLLLIGCALPRELETHTLRIDGNSVVTLETGVTVAEIVGVDYVRYGGRIFKSYRVDMCERAGSRYESEVTAVILKSGAEEVHITYPKR